MNGFVHTEFVAAPVHFRALRTFIYTFHTWNIINNSCGLYGIIGAYFELNLTRVKFGTSKVDYECYDEVVTFDF